MYGVVGIHIKESCYLLGFRTELTDELRRLIWAKLDRQVYTLDTTRSVLAKLKKAVVPRTVP